MKSTFLIALLLCVPISRALAADWYVDAVSGDDTNSGASSADAWRTVTHALESISGRGNTVHVAAGLYDVGLGEVFPWIPPTGTVLAGSGRDVVTVRAPDSRYAISAHTFTSGSPLELHVSGMSFAGSLRSIEVTVSGDDDA